MGISYDWNGRASKEEVDPWEQEWDAAPKTESCQDNDSPVYRNHKLNYGEDRNRTASAGKHAAGRVRKKSKAVAKRRKGN